jgi:pyruvate dehydrogenase E1 component alpha subunit
MAQTKAAVPSARLDTALARALLTQMQLIRRFEEKAAEMYAMGKIGGFLHLYIGQEAVAVGAMSTLRPDDTRYPRTASTATAWPRAPIRSA